MFTSALRAVKDIHEQLREISLQGDNPKVSIDDMKFVIEEMYGVEIEIHNIVFDFYSVLSAMYRYGDNKIKIYIPPWQDERMQRFGAANEFAHIIMDEEGHRSADGAELIETLTTERVSLEGEAPRDMGPAEISEILAPIIATELLYPFQQRLQDFEHLKDGEKTEKELAEYYDLPEFVIDDALRQEMLDLIGEYWEKANRIPQTSG